MEESRKVVGNGEFSEKYEEEFSSVVEMSRKWCLITEEISKVNWFLKIRKRLKNSFSA
jgi:hypothetical protein